MDKYIKDNSFKIAQAALYKQALKQGDLTKYGYQNLMYALDKDNFYGTVLATLKEEFGITLVAATKHALRDAGLQV